MRSDRVTVTRRGSGAHTPPQAEGCGLECPASVFYLINTPLPKGVWDGEGKGLPPPPPTPPLSRGRWHVLALGLLRSRRPSGLRKTRRESNSLAHRTTWLRSDFPRRFFI